MYNLTFDNPYNRDIVRKLDRFRNKQQGYFVPSNIEPEHLTHQYDPITITGGARAIQAPSVRSSIVNQYPPDLFEPRYTFNRNHMTGNRLQGGSDMLHQKFYQPTTFNSGIASYDSDVDIDDLGKVHAIRRGKRVMVGGYTTGLAPVTKDSLDRLEKEFKKVKVGKPKKGGDFWSDALKENDLYTQKSPLVSDYKNLSQEDMKKLQLEYIKGLKKKEGGYSKGLAPVSSDTLEKFKRKKGGYSKGLAPISKDVLEKFKRIKGGKKPKKEKESKPISKLLKIFN